MPAPALTARGPTSLASGLLRLALLAGLAAGPTTGCTPGEGSAADDRPLRVAASADGEGALLARIVASLLTAAELDVELVEFGDARDTRQALELGAVDVALGYTGEAWLETLGRADPPGDAEASFEPVRSSDAQQDILWLRPTFGDGLREPPADATFAFVVTETSAEELATVSQLAARLEEQPDASVCVDREFGVRQDGLRAVLDAYRVGSDREFLAATPEEAVRAVAAGDCLAGLTTATDGAAWAAGLRPLIDDLEVFPAFVPAVQVREEAVERVPEVEAALAPFGQELTTVLLGQLNARVTVGEPVDTVATEAAEELIARAADDAEDAEDAEGPDDGQDPAPPDEA